MIIRMTACVMASLWLGSARADSFSNLYSLSGSDGSQIYGRLAYQSGVIYGVTQVGGTNSAGTIFQLRLSDNTFLKLHDFNSSTDGASADAGLTVINSMLEGVTTQGGSFGYGTLYKLNVKNFDFTTLHAFNGTDGSAAESQLVRQGSSLWGTTGAGGTGLGTIFQVPSGSGTLNTVYTFPGSQGTGTPLFSLTSYRGVFYGTTSSELQSSNFPSTIFAFNPNTGNLSTLHSFGNGNDGTRALSGLTLVGKTLYGTTFYGGTNNLGTVYSFNPATGIETVIYNFAGPDGSNPGRGVVYLNGNLYGVTLNGGASSLGTLYRIDLATKLETVLHSFNGLDGAYPDNDLVVGGGVIYGATLGDTIFSYMP